MAGGVTTVKRLQVLRALGALGALAGAASPLRAAAGAPRSLTIHLYHAGGPNGKPGPDHQKHDAFVPANFTIAAGVPVRITVINSCPEFHSMTCAAIPLDQEMTPAKRNKDGSITPVATTFTITARAGTYRWYCKEPCDMASGMWAMTPGETGRGQEQYMAGHITAV